MRHTPAPAAESAARRSGGGVPVVVVRPHRHQCQPRAERGEPVEVLVATAVVRHLEHVHAEPRQVAGQRGLRRRLDVPGQQDPYPTHLGDEDHAGVVGRRLSAGRPGGHPAAATPSAAVTSPTRRVTAVRRGAGSRPTAAAPVAGAVGRVEQPGALDLPHLTAPEHTGHPVDVVGVEVGEHQERHRGDLETVEAGVRRAPGRGRRRPTTPPPARRAGPGRPPARRRTSPAPSRAAASPGSGGRTSITTSRRPVQARVEPRSAQHPRGQRHRHAGTAAVSSTSGTGPVPQSTAAVGTSAPHRATAMIQPRRPRGRGRDRRPAGSTAGRPATRRDPARSPVRPPARPAGWRRRRRG